MSYVVAATDLLEVAASDLAGINTVLAEAASAAAVPTTGVIPAAADEVSQALAALFGNFGRQYQLMSAQAQTFHAQFVAMMNSGAGAYVSAELANAGQAIANAVVAPVQSLLAGGLSGGGSAGSAAGGGSGLLGGLLGGTTGVSAMDGVLGGLTGGSGGLTGISAGLGGIGTSVGGLLGGVTPSTGGLTGITAGLGATIGNAVSGLTGAGTSLGGLLGGGTGLGGLLGGSTGLGGLLGGLTGGTGNIGSLLGNLSGGLNGVVTSIGGALSSLGNIGSVTGFLNSVPGLLGTINNLGALGANLQNTLASLLPGLPTSLAGLENSLSGLVNSLFPNLVNVNFGNMGPVFTGLFGPYEQLFYNTVTNLQALGADWLANPFPFLRQFVANQIGYGQTILTALQTGNYAPVSAIPGKIATNFGNVVHTVTDISVKSTVDVLTSGGAPLAINNMIGLPLVAGAAVIGPPAAAFQAAQGAATAFMSAVQAGDGAGAFAAAFGFPATVLDGFLNGHAVFPYSLNLGQITWPVSNLLGIPLNALVNVTAVANLPLDGLLVQPGYYPLSVTLTTLANPLVPPIGLNVGAGGTPFSGLLQLLINYTPQQLAVAVGAPTSPPPFISIPLPF
ncbi:PE family protein [Mycobacterium vicinigordonae]|uniref:PE family protein n=1 Tax=Mycobacterium vicinigordonae TaxID=1719132 RepID=A0A7D6I677_9MYCO|nr:PE family protein [Mycobacterium vicinigordonae]QLL07918.1 PE family protein [Mycobacterium vicinigordonae]